MNKDLSLLMLVKSGNMYAWISCQVEHIILITLANIY